MLFRGKVVRGDITWGNVFSGKFVLGGKCVFVEMSFRGNGPRKNKIRGIGPRGNGPRGNDYTGKCTQLKRANVQKKF
jgi:hypothetical protein